MPWMKHPTRKNMYFHPIDYKDAQRDKWIVIDPPRGEELSEYLPVTPGRDTKETSIPEGASIAGGDDMATETSTETSTDTSTEEAPGGPMGQTPEAISDPKPAPSPENSPRDDMDSEEPIIPEEKPKSTEVDFSGSKKKKK